MVICLIFTGWQTPAVLGQGFTGRNCVEGCPRFSDKCTFYDVGADFASVICCQMWSAFALSQLTVHAASVSRLNSIIRGYGTDWSLCCVTSPVLLFVPDDQRERSMYHRP